MDLHNLSSGVKLTLGLVFAYLAYHIYSRLNLRQRRQAIQRQKGTLEAPWYPQRESIVGWQVFQQTLKAVKANRLLETAMQRFQRMNANTYQMVLNGTHFWVTMEPENLKAIQATDFKKWGFPKRRKISLTKLLGDGIFTLDGAGWAHSREMLRPNFAKSQVADLETFERHVAHLIAAVPTNGATVDLSDLFFRLTMDSATEFLFGESTESLSNGSGEGFALAFSRSQETVGNLTRFGNIYKLFPQYKQLGKDVKFVQDFADHYVRIGLKKRDQVIAAKARDEKNQKYYFIDELVSQTTDPVRIRSELLNILLAGRDTTASLLTNLWHTLSVRPDLWEKLQSELAHLGSKAPTFDQIKEIKFLRALINESLRLHPVVPGNSREAQADTTLPLGGGPDGMAPLFIPKGGLVTWSVYSMQRRKDIYGQDAHEFKPERWLDDPVTGKKGLRPGWEYLPFNGGARICLGQQFAITEASYTTIRLCQAFDKMESRDSHPWTESLALTCTNLHGTKVALSSRQ
nr:cytochrome p450 52a12 [Quercus suber]